MLILSKTIHSLINFISIGFPTIKIFGANKRSPVDYNQQRTAQAFADAALAEAKKKVSAKLGGSSSGGSSSGSDEVIVLTDANFDKLVLQSDDVWLVEVRINDFQIFRHLIKQISSV